MHGSEQPGCAGARHGVTPAPQNTPPARELGLIIPSQMPSPARLGSSGGGGRVAEFLCVSGPYKRFHKHFGKPRAGGQLGLRRDPPETNQGKC
ncbi:protein of unknown function [Cupriavidus taiwanensis]|uniref:Uncharacterized protein n=1 Tax=Cupriavidus taiwanensis TaxID=164546 RepID=A0A375IBY1_9BURK|nr:hypothetical protein CBM2629_A150049 [Cupriavidus taiwanensis]SPK72107.1 protein of unknown function [Cupriavidus taiwanensis]